MSSTIRPPAVAGRFYPRDAQMLLGEVQAFLSPRQERRPALGCIVPHAGYIYSGHVAGAVFARIEIPQRCIVLCPNHTGRGTPLSIMSAGTWETPLGPVTIDSQLAEDLKSGFALLREDSEAHRSEHAIEVELPFLQVLNRQCAFVPIAVGTAQFEALEELGRAMGEALREQAEPVLIVASSDMNHYQNDAVTRVKDHKAIERILALDARGLYDTVLREDISMCGFGPAVAMLTAVRALGAKSADLVKYATSGDISGDRETVVGYAGVLIN